MNSSLTGLSLKQAPALSVPLRFFLTAPVFLLLAAILLWSLGATAWASRWSVGILALTHLITLGYLSMVMLGALLQMLPVVAGSVVPGGKWLVTWVHSLFTLAILLLIWALWQAKFSWWMPIVGLMGLALGGFILATLFALFRSMVRHATVRMMRYAVLALGVTAGSGMLMLAELADDGAVRWLVKLHIIWGTMGWMLFLVMGVAWQVVPMFLLTRPYPALLMRYIGVGWLLLLLAASFGMASTGMASTGTILIGKALPVVLGLLACGVAFFSVITLYLLEKRRRKKADASLWFWRISMVSLLGASGLWLTASVLPALATWAGYPFVLGGLFLYGGMISLVNGMLYKIVPFLIWLHWQARLSKGQLAPHVRQIIPDSVAQRQMWVHLASLFALLASVWWSAWVEWVELTAGLVALSAILSWLAMWQAAWRYWRQAV